MNSVAKLKPFAIPLLSLALLPIISPIYFGLKLLRFIKSRLHPQNVADKVVLITGSSSGIGEHPAYEYGKRGARLALTARRQDRLQAVAEKAKKLGSPDVLVIPADVSKPQDCKSLVGQTVTHFGQLDHLVNNAGALRASVFQDCNDVSCFVQFLDTNFWGSVHCTHSAIPHLCKTNGKSVVISSLGSWLPAPKLSLYNASKAAVTRFFETLRVELGSQIGITIAIPSIIRSEITSDEFLAENRLKYVQRQLWKVYAEEIDI